MLSSYSVVDSVYVETACKHLFDVQTMISIFSSCCYNNVLSDGCLGDDVKRGLLSVMRDFPSSLTVQSLSCQILESIAVTGEDGWLMGGGLDLFYTEWDGAVCIKIN